jgi:hypothetical protein
MRVVVDMTSMREFPSLWNLVCYFVIEKNFPDIEFLSCFGRCHELVATPVVNIVDKLVNEFKCTFSA